MDGINVLYAFQYTASNGNLVDYLKNKLKKELLESGFGIGLFDTTNNKELVEEQLETGKYNVLVCAEQLGEEKISSASLKAWSQKYPDLKVILGVGKEKKGGEKLLRLLTSAPFYYDAVYEGDLTGDVIASLIKKSRTREEAISYYGLETRIGDTKKEEKVTSSIEEKAPEKIVEAEVITEEEFEKEVAKFGELDFDEKVLQVEEEKKETEASFDYGAMFGGMSEKAKENPLFEEDNEDSDFIKGLTELEKRVDEKIQAEKGGMKVEEKLADGLLKAVQTIPQKGVVLPEAGTVLKIFDHNTMLFNLDQELILPFGEDVEDYKIFFVVKGTKGGYVNGKYKVGVKSFEGYPGSLLGKSALMVEVPEFDLIQNQMNQKACSVLFIKQ